MRLLTELDDTHFNSMLFGNPLSNAAEPALWGGGWVNQLPGLDDVSNLVHCC
jgi:hypothetical protein